MAKIAIITNFQGLPVGYSLTTIIKDQCRMLVEYGHDVHLFVQTKYGKDPVPEGITLHKTIPFAHLKDYRTIADLTEDHKKTVEETANVLKESLQDFDCAFTHDFIFTGWNLPYGLGVKLASKYLPKVRWFHWVHSVPSTAFDWWMIREYGSKHKIVFPNEGDRQRVAEQFRGSIDDVRTIPHVRDLRSFFDFDPETCAIIKDYPEIMQAEIVSVYPASVDRLEAKGVKFLIDIFGSMKRDHRRSVCLFIANQWATGRQQRENVEEYKKLAVKAGLEPGRDFIFSSDWQQGKFGVGVPQRILRELMMCMNLFIFPTHEESFGLVLPEAVLASGCFPVVNLSLPVSLEMTAFKARAFNFGSNSQMHNIPPERYPGLMHDIALVIIGRMFQNESVAVRTLMRRRYNWNNIYHQYYAPLMSESNWW